MTDTSTKDPVEVHVAGKDQPEAARLLLGAAKDLELPVDVVQTIAGGFLVPHEVAVKAGALSDEDGDGSTGTPATETQDDAHPEVTDPGSELSVDVQGAGALAGSTGTEDAQRVQATSEEPAGAVQTEDGTVHEGVVPASAAVQPADDDEDTTPGSGILRGEALEKALHDRLLSTSGTADEKRARVAEYDAQHAGTQQQ